MLFNKVVLRLEGEVNQFWDFINEDGSSERFEAIEGSPIYCEGEKADERVQQHDPKLAMLLQILIDLANPYQVNYDSVTEVTFDYNGKVVKVENE